MKIKVLSIDGGGVRGIIPATILAYMENKIIELTGKPSARISDYLDFVAGTSTGSIIAAMAITPDEKGRPLYKMDDVVQSYLEIAGKVFKKDWKRNIKTLWGIIGTKYSASTIDNELLKKLDHRRLNELLTGCAFTGYDTAKRKPVIYTNKDDNQKYGNLFIKDVVRGSTSIPYIFPPAYFRDGVDINTMVDGGVFANNPSLVAYVEVSKTKEIIEKYKDVSPSNTLILSFGTGKAPLITYPYDKIKKWGLLKWFTPLLNILLSGMSEITTYEMQKIFDDNGACHNYIRINPQILIGNGDAQDASDTNMKRLSQDAMNYISANQTFLDNVVKELIDNSGFLPQMLF